MADDENKKLFDDLTQKRVEITELKKKLNTINIEKEKCYSEKEEVSSRIKELINEIKVLKKERDEQTAEVRKQKNEKGKVIAEIKAEIDKIIKLKKERQDISKKFNIRGDPVRLKKQIEDLEYKIETEAVSFEKEQKLMKTINDLKSKFSEFSEVGSVVDDINKTSSNIDSLKKKEKEFKKNIRKGARESQKRHEKMLELSKVVDELKTKEKEHYEKFSGLKAEFANANKRLKEMLSEMGGIKDNVEKFRTKRKEEQKAKKEMTIKEKKDLVNEKIKKGEKLTTEDLLVFQR